MQLHELKSPAGARTRKHIVGRGAGSGMGKTSGRGHKGQKSRAGRGIVRGTEGGQIPLIRRLPKVGFRRSNPLVYQLVPLSELNRFEKSTVVTAQLLKDSGLVKNIFKPFKILANGEVKKSLTVQAYSFSKTAEEKIVKAGGKVEVITVESLVTSAETRK